MFMEQNYVCKFCGAQFHREKTLSTHICTKKRRHMDADSTGPRLGFRVFQKFYELTSNSKNQKTLQEFIDSRYYIDFVKFGNHLALLKPIYMDEFVSYVIKNNFKLSDWSKDYVYFCYLQELLKTEPSSAAVERTISEIVDWCGKNSVEFREFFKKITPNEASHMIRFGKISPWVLYLSSTGSELISKFNEDHTKIIDVIIDPGFWMKKFKKNKEDVDFIRSILDGSGL